MKRGCITCHENGICQPKSHAAAFAKLCVKSVETQPPRDDVLLSSPSWCPCFQDDNAAVSGWWLCVLQHDVLTRRLQLRFHLRTAFFMDINDCHPATTIRPYYRFLQGDNSELIRPYILVSSWSLLQGQVRPVTGLVVCSSHPKPIQTKNK